MAQFNADILFNADVRKALQGVDRLEGGIRSVVKEIEKFEATFKRIQGQGPTSKFQLEQQRKLAGAISEQNRELTNQIALASKLGSVYDANARKASEFFRVLRAVVEVQQKALPGAGFPGQKALPAAGQTRGEFQRAAQAAAVIDAQNALAAALRKEAAAREEAAKASADLTAETVRIKGLLPPSRPGFVRGQQAASGSAPGVVDRGGRGGRTFQGRIQREVDRQLAETGKLTKEIQETVASYNKLQTNNDRLVKTTGRLATAQGTAAKNADKNKRAFTGGGGLSAGIGFPLLFGSGLGSVLGGAAGSAFGFGEQILGSALGGQLDQLNQKAADFAKALRGLGSILDALESAVSGVDNATKLYIKNLENSGQKVAAAAAASDVLAEKIGDENAKAFIRAGQAADNASESVKNLGSVLVALSERFRAAGENPTGLTPNGVLDLLPPQFRPDPPTPIEDTPEFKNRTKDLKDQLNIEQLITQQKLQQAALSSRDLEVKKIIRDLDEGSLDAEQAQLLIGIADTKLQRELADLEKQRLSDVEQRLKAQDRARKAEARELERQRRERERAAQELSDRQQKFNSAAVSLLDLSVKTRELDKGRIAAIDRELLFIDRKQGFIEQNILLSEKDVQLQQILLDTARQKADNKERELKLERARIQLTRESELTAISRNGEDFRQGIVDQSAGIALGLQDPFGTSQQIQEQLLALEQMERRTAALMPLKREINDLQEQAVRLQKLESDEARDARQNRISELQKQLTLNSQALEGLEQLELAQSRYNRVLEAATPFANAFAAGLTSGLQEVVAGTKTAEEAFADFLKNIADLLVQTAAQMIAQYIAIGIARAFAGIPAADGGKVPNVKSGGPKFADGFGFLSSLDGFAEGGRPEVGAVSLVGERGPELFVPDQPGRIISNRDSQAALQRYNPANARSIEELAMSGGGSTKSEWGGAPQPMQTSINIEGGVMQFNDTNYIRQDQVPSIITQASKQGEARALRKLQMSPAARRRAGI